MCFLLIARKVYKKGKAMADIININKAPYDFGRSIFLPFQTGPGSAAFVFKSAAVYGVLITVLLFLFGKMVMGSFVEFMQYAIEMEDAPGDASEMEVVMKMFAMMGKMALPMLLISIGGWAIWAMVEAAFLRRAMRGEDDGFLPWRFGKDELRVLFCRLIVGLAGFATLILVHFVLGVLLFGVFAGGSGSGVMGVIVGIVTFLGVLAAFALFIFIVIRLSPASALSIAEDRFALGDTWPVAKGRFWPMFGSYALITVVGYIIANVIQTVLIIAFTGSFLAMIPEFEKMGGMPPEEAVTTIMEILTQPSILTGLAVAMFLYYVFQAIWYLHFAGVAAHATNLYNTDRAENSVDVFS